MADDTGSNISKQPVAVASALRQRKKRKWDEPANFLISPGIAIPGSISMGIGSTLGISTPGVLPLSNAIATSTILPSIIPNAATLIQKLNQPKVQDELIAREIVINDAEPTIRYKLTKRQTQEEIQRSTGAVVITRGKYRPPNAFSDGEKPLYLHISAASHLKDMAERIIAVDRAAFMVEEILRQGYNSQTPGPYTAFNSTGQVIQSLSTCVFLGFEPDPSQNIAARIRGPNDQYINHIINETGASVVLRGLGSGNHDISYTEETQQLHLHLSSASSKSLEAARSLAENLLDTISAECGASRVSSSKLYSAVPPPQQLLAGVQSSATIGTSVNPVVSSSCVISSIPQAAQSPASSSLVVSSVSTLSSLGALIQNGNSIPNTGFYVHPTANPGTCYSGYGGIYPQATPLQQVALALKSAPVSTTSVVPSMTSHTNALPRMTSSSKADLDKRPPQKRKFQELPVTAKGLTAINQNSLQGSECFKPGLKDDADTRKFSSIPLPKKPTQFGEMPPPPPPPRMMPPPPPGMMPPPPPKFPSAQPHFDALSHSSKVIPSPPLHFPSSQPPLEANSQNLEALVEIPKSSTEPVSDTVLKLVEYEEEDEDDTSASAEESCRSNVVISSSSKPFWAL